MFDSLNLQDRLSFIEKYVLSAMEDSADKTRYTFLHEYGKNPSFDEEMKNLTYDKYCRSAVVHYFVSRMLFMNHIYHYSFFSAQQCIECYFKAFLKLQEHEVEMTHDLSKLLSKCRNIVQNQQNVFPFLFDRLIEGIIARYNPYNEWPRYPVYKTGPQEKEDCWVFPDDILYLDYFVFRIQGYFPAHPKFKDGIGQILGLPHMVIVEKPQFIEMIKWENINFMATIGS